MEGKVKTKKVPPDHGEGHQYMPKLVAGEEVVKSVYEQQPRGLKSQKPEETNKSQLKTTHI